MFTISANALKSMVRLPGEVIPPRTTMPIIQSVLVDVKGGILTIAGTDLSCYVKKQMPVISDKDFALCIPYRLLESYLSGASGDLVIDSKDYEITIKQEKARSKFSLKGLDAAEFPPEMPFDENAPCITMSGNALASVIHRILFAVSDDDLKYVLNSIHVVLRRNPDNSVSVIFEATDGIRAVSTTTDAQLSDELLDMAMDSEKGRVNVAIIPDYYAKMLLKLESESVTISFDIPGNRLSVDVTDDAGVRTVLKAVSIEGNFPDIYAVTPKEASLKGRIAIDAMQLSTAIKRCLLFKSSIDFVKITLLGGNVATISADGELGSTETDIECDNTGELKELASGFEGKYMIQQMKVMAEEIDPVAIIKFSSSKSPFVIVPRDSPIEYQALLMPKFLS